MSVRGIQNVGHPQAHQAAAKRGASGHECAPAHGPLFKQRPSLTSRWKAGFLRFLTVGFDPSERGGRFALWLRSVLNPGWRS